jgi:hypothetical protein
MHVGEISFCNRIGYNIKSDEFKKTVLDRIADYGCRVIQKHHEKFTSADVLNANPHLMTLRTNGNPYYLFLTTYNGVNQCIFIDKKVQQGYVYPRMVIVKFWMDDALFQGGGTLFSGEMVNGDGPDQGLGGGAWTFLIHDVFGDSGADTSSVNLVRRINRCYEILSKLWCRDGRQDVCDIRVKRYFHYHEHAEMTEWMRWLPYSCRGVYFKPLYTRFKDILFNFDDTLVKKVAKVATYNNKQFVTREEQEALALAAAAAVEEAPTRAVMQVQKTSQPDIYQVFSADGADAGIAMVNNMRVSKMLRERFEKATPVDKVKFISVFNARFGKWEPVEEQRAARK